MSSSGHSTSSRENCPKCGGKLSVIACIEDPDVIAKILEHIRARDAAGGDRRFERLAQISNGGFWDHREMIVIHGFHSDNGSEYVNHSVARLLEKLRIEFTKSRARQTNDNALVESKNGSKSPLIPSRSLWWTLSTRK